MERRWKVSYNENLISDKIDGGLIAEREERKKFDKWRERVRNKLPELASRVFALRNKGYTGCGFGWAIEKDLGYIIRSVSNFDSYPDWMEQTLIKVVTESLYKDLNRIENELSRKEVKK